MTSRLLLLLSFNTIFGEELDRQDDLTLTLLFLRVADRTVACTQSTRCNFQYLMIELGLVTKGFLLNLGWKSAALWLLRLQVLLLPINVVLTA